MKLFKEVGFQLEIETNFKEVDFFDVMFNLVSGLYTPQKKPSKQLVIH